MALRHSRQRTAARQREHLHFMSMVLIDKWCSVQPCSILYYYTIPLYCIIRILYHSLYKKKHKNTIHNIPHQRRCMAPKKHCEGRGASFASAQKFTLQIKHLHTGTWPPRDFVKAAAPPSPPTFGLGASSPLKACSVAARQLGPGLPNPILYSHARYPMALLAFDIWGLIALEDALSRRRQLGPGLPNPMLCSLATCPMALLAVDIWSWGPHRP